MSAASLRGYDSEWPNVTAQTNRALIKWNAWIDVPRRALPCPTSSFDEDDVGLFEGAQYQATGWYTSDVPPGKMNNPTYDFFASVCSEQLVKCIYQVVDPIDSFLPSDDQPVRRKFADPLIQRHARSSLPRMTWPSSG